MENPGPTGEAELIRMQSILRLEEHEDAITDVRSMEGNQEFEVQGEFTRFPSLPMELRLQIWEALLEPRTVTVSEPHPLYFRVTVTERYIPLICEINHESRSVARKNYQLWPVDIQYGTVVLNRRQRHYARKRLYFNSKIDIMLNWVHGGERPMHTVNLAANIPQVAISLQKWEEELQDRGHNYLEFRELKLERVIFVLNDPGKWEGETFPQLNVVEVSEEEAFKEEAIKGRSTLREEMKVWRKLISSGREEHPEWNEPVLGIGRLIFGPSLKKSNVRGPI